VIKKKDVIWCLLLILLVLPMLVVAVAPSTTVNIQAETPGLTILHPIIEFFPEKTNITLSFRTLNSTNFLTSRSNNVSCELHIINNTGDHVVTETLLRCSSCRGFHYVSNKDTFKLGIYSYVVNCNSSLIQEAGFTSSTFEVTRSGLEENTITYTILYLGLLVVLMFFLILSIAGAWNINGENEYDLGGGLVKVNFNKYFKLGLFFLSYLLLIFVVFISLVISTNYLFLDTFSVILDTIHFILWILLAPVFLAFIVHSLQKFILDLKLQDLAKRNLKERKGGSKKW